ATVPTPPLVGATPIIKSIKIFASIPVLIFEERKIIDDKVNLSKADPAAYYQLELTIDTADIDKYDFVVEAKPSEGFEDVRFELKKPDGKVNIFFEQTDEIPDNYELGIGLKNKSDGKFVEIRILQVNTNP
ncbi:hypothetical protein KY342_00785, partial [Candidatus Woesearchaeota archaeon]|nr:hypothetical protein [Candidatus Woesearchaeota archaeon]